MRISVTGEQFSDPAIEIEQNTATPSIPEVMSESELCELLNISPATAWRLRKARKLGYCKYGTKIKYLRRHVVAFLDVHEVKAAELMKSE